VLIDQNQITDANGFGAGIYIGNPYTHAPGIITIDRVSVTGNTTSSGGVGGGIYLEASAAISNSLIRGNTATSGGGMALYEGAGSSVPVTITLTNMTLSENSVVETGGGIHSRFMSASDSATLNNVTIADNIENVYTPGLGGGGIYDDGAYHNLSLENSILSGNTAVIAGADCLGTIHSLDYNLIGDTSGCTITGTTTAHDITGVSANLDVAADHGGATLTRPLIAGSPAIDKGNDATCAANDQRGVARAGHGAHCDMGAFEVGAYTWVVNTILDHNDGACDSDCTLHEAIVRAWDNEPVNFAPGLSGTIPLYAGFNLLRSISINGPTGGALSLDGADGMRLFHIYPGVHASLSNLTLTHGYVMDGYGGCILNNGYLTLAHVTLSNCQALSSTTANGGGGAIFNDETLVISNSNISNNTAQNGGGAIQNGFNASLSISDTTLNGNRAIADAGGALYIPNPGGTIDLNRLNVTDNLSYTGGGGVFLAGSGDLSNSLVANNMATGTASLGGGIQIVQSGSGDTPVSINLANDTVSDNTAFGGGGGIHADLEMVGDTVILNNLTIADNHRTVIPGPSGPNGGGGIFVQGSKTIDLKNSIIAGNTSGVGGPDCEGTINSLDYNLIQDTTNCTISGINTTHNKTGVSANLAALANNGGPTQTMNLLPGSPAIDAGNTATCLTFDQRNYNRPVGSACDMGALEFGYAISGNAGTGWAQLSYTDNGPRQAHADGDGNYSLLVPSGWSGVVTPSNSGQKFMPASRSYSNVTAYQAGQDYKLLTTVSLASVGAQDGWVLESSEISNKGGSINSSATTFMLGDDASKRQYRAILSFNTSANLPAAAVITKVMLKVNQQGILGGGNPVGFFQGFLVDVRKGYFGSALALQASDFQAAAGATLGPFKLSAVSNWYSINLTGASAQISKVAVTQVRLRFKLDDNGDAVANILKLFSGNAPPAKRPQLVITYYVP
jgi:hypothetical protein